MKRFVGIFVLGLAALLPAGLVVYAIGRLLWGAEQTVRQWLEAWLPEGLYLPGTGLAVAALAIVLTGMLAQSWIGPPIGRWVSGQVGRIPLLGPVYLSLRDVSRRFSGDRPAGFRTVVFVAGEGGGGRLGLVADPTPLSSDLGGRDLVPVYFPAAFQPGGELELVPEERLEPTDMSLDQAVGLIISGGLARSTDDPREADIDRRSRG